MHRMEIRQNMENGKWFVISWDGYTTSHEVPTREEAEWIVANHDDPSTVWEY